MASLDEGKKGHDTKNNERRKTLTHSVHVAHVPFSFAMFLPSQAPFVRGMKEERRKEEEEEEGENVVIKDTNPLCPMTIG